MNKKAGVGRLIVILLVIVVALAAVYFGLFFAYSCDDVACFRGHQEKCSRTKFVNDAEDATWKYHIRGKEEGKCEIDVTLVQVKTGKKINTVGLEGRTMTCLLPIGSLISPESDLSACYGDLKEGLQQTIINKLHAYIVENVGEIGEELQGVV